jgi:prophage regulatory protein
MSERLIRLPDVSARVGMARTAIYKRIKEGAFPSPVKTGRMSSWVESEIEAWIAQQIDGSRGVTAIACRQSGGRKPI